LIKIGSKTAEKNSAQTNRQRDKHLAVNQQAFPIVQQIYIEISVFYQYRYRWYNIIYYSRTGCNGMACAVKKRHWLG